MASHAEICPVCEGVGRIKDYRLETMSTIDVYVYRTCNGCAGIGWITVIDSSD